MLNIQVCHVLAGVDIFVKKQIFDSGGTGTSLRSMALAEFNHFFFLHFDSSTYGRHEKSSHRYTAAVWYIERNDKKRKNVGTL